MRRNPLVIGRRFNGPRDSANGGVTSGMLARYVDADAVQVTLRKPPPLDTEMRVQDGQLFDGDVLIAEAGPGTVDVAVPAAVDLETAAAAASSYAGLVDHPFPTCFVCGPARSDGLGLTPGRVGAGVVAATWTPEAPDPVMVWAVLDCPGGWSADLPGRPLVLGQMTCRVERVPVPGQPHVIQGWLLGTEGRRVQTGSALYDAQGQVLAVAQATWFTIA